MYRAADLLFCYFSFFPFFGVRSGCFDGSVWCDLINCNDDNDDDDDDDDIQYIELADDNTFMKRSSCSVVS